MKIFKRVLCLGLSAVFILSIVIPVFAETEEKGPVTKTSYGFVRGLYYDGGECYLGIPYAKATTGNLRFTPHRAKTRLPACFCLPEGINGTSSGEVCL